MSGQQNRLMAESSALCVAGDTYPEFFVVYQYTVVPLNRLIDPLEQVALSML